MTGLEQQLALGQEWLWHSFLVFLRVGSVVALMPGFGEQSVPVRVKLALSIAATMALVPLLTPQEMDAWTLASLGKFVLAEPFAGLIFGIGLRLFVMVLQTAGTIAAQSTSLSQILGNTAEPMPAIGHILVIGGLALAMMAGLHVKMLGYIAHSYTLIPAGEFPSPELISNWAVQQVSQSFSLAFQLSAPFVIVSLLYNLALGAINRAMPQLMVAFVGAPAITAAGMVLLALLVPSILLTWLAEMDLFLVNPAGGNP